MLKNQPWKTSFFFFCLCSIKMRTHVFNGRKVPKYAYSITKTRLYNFDPLKPDFFKAKLGFSGLYINFLISAQNIDCGYSLEPPRRGGSNEYPQSMFWAEIWKISEFFIGKFSFLVVKFSAYLNRHVFVMDPYAYVMYFVSLRLWSETILGSHRILWGSEFNRMP